MLGVAVGACIDGMYKEAILRTKKANIEIKERINEKCWELVTLSIERIA